MKLPHRRQFLHLAAGAAALPAVSRIAWAQTYPMRPITMIVPFPAGGPTDTIGRIVAEGMRVSLRQPIIIENVTGAGGTIGVGRVARAAPDGHTLSVGFLGTHVLNGAIYTLQYALNDRARMTRLLVWSDDLHEDSTPCRLDDGHGRRCPRSFPRALGHSFCQLFSSPGSFVASPQQRGPCTVLTPSGGRCPCVALAF
jgi:hypothetical protein